MKCFGPFTGGSNGGDGHGRNDPLSAFHGKGTGVSLDHYSMKYFHLTPGDGGTQDDGRNVFLSSYGGGGGGVLVDGVGPDRESTCQGEGYGGGAGALTTHSLFKTNNFVGHLGLPGVILVEVY